MVVLMIQIFVNFVCALKKEEGVVEDLQYLPELQLPYIAIRVGLLMGIVMI